MRPHILRAWLARSWEIGEDRHGEMGDVDGAHLRRRYARDFRGCRPTADGNLCHRLCPACPMPSADYLIITALPEEREGVAKYLPGLRLVSNERAKAPRVYYEARLRVLGSPRVIVTTIGRLGRVSAATAATSAIETWCPDVVLLVGVAGGLASKNLRLGDVLLATQILDYEHQRVQEGRAPEMHPSTWPADVNIHRAAVDRVAGEWPGSISAKRPDGGIPSCRQGTIASGDKFVTDPNFLAPIIKEAPQLLGVEMEGGGVACACAESKHPTRFLMIRSVSDYADAKKDKKNRLEPTERSKWRTYACHSAGLFAIDVIRSYEQSLDRSSAVRTRVTSAAIHNADACFLGLPPGKTTCCRCQDLTDDSYARWPKLSKLVRTVAMLCRTRFVFAALALLWWLASFGQRLLPSPPVSGTTLFLLLLGLGGVPAMCFIGYTMKAADGLALKAQISEGKTSEDDLDNFLAIADGLAFPRNLLAKIFRSTR